MLKSAILDLLGASRFTRSVELLYRHISNPNTALQLTLQNGA